MASARDGQWGPVSCKFRQKHLKPAGITASVQEKLWLGNFCLHVHNSLGTRLTKGTICAGRGRAKGHTPACLVEFLMYSPGEGCCLLGINRCTPAEKGEG